MKLTKVIPQVVKIDTDLIKVNDIFNEKEVKELVETLEINL